VWPIGRNEVHGEGAAEDAAGAWRARGCTYEGARALGEAPGERSLLEALAIMGDLGAAPAARGVRQRLRERGASVPRGPRRSTRTNPGMVSGLPPTFMRLVAGDTLKIGERSFDVLTGNGHAPEQVMLYCAADNIFLAADQVLAKITPNISVWAVDPEGDPLGLYLRSLQEIKEQIPADALVLPGHQLPFYGLHRRSNELIAHHEVRCAAIAEACRAAPRSAAELVPVLFSRELDPHQMSFAFSEVQAHVNYMLRRGELAWIEGSDDIERVVVPGAQ